jgi:hypothetical protein
MDVKEAVLDFFDKAPEGKKRYMMNDIVKKLPDFPKKEIKKAIDELIKGGKLCYWSSGSTTYVSTPDSEAAKAAKGA